MSPRPHAGDAGSDPEPRPAPVTRRQFALLRCLFGFFLAVHCARLIPRGAELFSRHETFQGPAGNPLHGLFPNPLVHWNGPAAVTAWLVALTVLSLLFAAGVARRTTGVALWFGLTCLLDGYYVIAGPSLLSAEVLLLLTALVPPGEGWSLARRPPAEPWAMPRSVVGVAWTLMVAGYTFGGVLKLVSTGWTDGSALAHLLAGHVAGGGPLVPAVLAAPPVLLRLAAWGALAVELLAAPLALARLTRPWWWLAAVVLQLCVFAVVPSAGFAGGVLMLHLFTLDPRWLPAAEAPG